MGNFAIYSILENCKVLYYMYSNIFFTNLDIGHKPRKESDFKRPLFFNAGICETRNII